jgi:hypothetical protein
MSHSARLFRASIGVFGILTAIGSVERLGLAQTPKSTAASSRAVPRTPDGHPDLQGTWSFATITPLQRPNEYEGREKLTAAEVAKLEGHAVETRFIDKPPPKGQTGAYNQFWIDSGTRVVSTHRTSLIVDPPDGKLPPLTPAAQERHKRLEALREEAANPEALTTWDRCIVGFNAGPPMIGGGYNAYLQIVQAAGSVVLFNEMVHDARIIPVADQPALPKNLRQWKGLSKGRWEGQTFVVETTGFRPEGTGTLSLRGPSSVADENLRLTERFSLMDADTLLYEYTVDDPTVWAKPWSVAQTMWRTEQPVYEYACHEANYAMRGILGGARQIEQEKSGAAAGIKPQ